MAQLNARARTFKKLEQRIIIKNFAQNYIEHIDLIIIIFTKNQLIKNNIN